MFVYGARVWYCTRLERSSKAPSLGCMRSRSKLGVCSKMTLNGLVGYRSPEI
jgi:hypothetical protein